MNSIAAPRCGFARPHEVDEVGAGLGEKPHNHQNLIRDRGVVLPPSLCLLVGPFDDEVKLRRGNDAERNQVTTVVVDVVLVDVVVVNYIVVSLRSRVR